MIAKLQYRVLRIIRTVNMYQIKDKVAFITGSTSGIGLASAEALLQEGIKGVAITGTNVQNGEVISENFNNKYGDGKTIFIKLDVTDKKQFHDAFKTTIDAFNNLDIVINSTGVIMDKDWEREIAINLTGTVTGTILAMEEYLPKYRSTPEAVIINLSSILGLEENSGIAVYGATKHGILGLSRNLGTKLHYERSKVRIMACCPSFTATPLLNFKESSFLTDHHCDMLYTEYPVLPVQHVDNVSKAIVHMIKEGENGSAWVTENDLPPYEVEFLRRDQRKKIRS